MFYTRCYVLYFAVRWARANVFGLRAFARVRGAKYCTNLHVVRMWLAEAWGKPVSAGLVRSSVWQGFIDAARHCDTTLQMYNQVAATSKTRFCGLWPVGWPSAGRLTVF